MKKGPSVPYPGGLCEPVHLDSVFSALTPIRCQTLAKAKAHTRFEACASSEPTYWRLPQGHPKHCSSHNCCWFVSVQIKYEALFGILWNTGPPIIVHKKSWIQQDFLVFLKSTGSLIREDFWIFEDSESTKNPPASNTRAPARTLLWMRVSGGQIISILEPTGRLHSDPIRFTILKIGRPCRAQVRQTRDGSDKSRPDLFGSVEEQVYSV